MESLYSDTNGVPLSASSSFYVLNRRPSDAQAYGPTSSSASVPASAPVSDNNVLVSVADGLQLDAVNEEDEETDDDDGNDDDGIQLV